MAETCPVCGANLVRKPGEAAWRCPNRECFPRLIKKISHFTSKGAMDIDGLGPKISEQLITAGLVKDIGDIFSIKMSDLLSLERFADKSARNLLDSIEKSKDTTLPRFLYALGISHVGSVTAQVIAKHMGSLEAISAASLEELMDIDGIGPEMAESISNWFSRPVNQDILERLLKAGIRFKDMKSEEEETPLSGKTFVFTGALSRHTREEARDMVIKKGGQVVSSVGRETSYCVMGEKPGSKYQKAIKLGVKILNEEEFLKTVS
jgi:DNA ligase (NAD+)